MRNLSLLLFGLLTAGWAANVGAGSNAEPAVSTNKISVVPAAEKSVSKTVASPAATTPKTPFFIPPRPENLDLRVSKNAFVGLGAAILGGSALITSIYWQDWIDNAANGSYRAYREYDANNADQAASMRSRYPGLTQAQIYGALYDGYTSDVAWAAALRWGGVALLGAGLAWYVAGLPAPVAGVTAVPLRDGAAFVYRGAF